MPRLHLLIAALLLLALPARAEDRIVDSSATTAKKGLYPIAVPLAVASDPASAKLVAEVVAFDLGASGWFKVLDPRSFLADLPAEGLSIQPQRWKDVGAYGVVKYRVVAAGTKLTLQLKLYEVDKGATPSLEKEYSGTTAEARALAHRLSGDVLAYLTGDAGFFGSRLVFSVRQKKGTKIFAMDYDGGGLVGVTNNDSTNILPAFTPSGQIAFTSYMRGNPDLYVSSGSGRPKRLARYPGMNTGASYSPDGSKLAITLSKDGNPDIYILAASDGAILARLTQHPAIDTSPAWSPDGSEIAFVSNREGSPQIYVMGADGSNQHKVSTVGSFNQTPAWSPEKGRRLLAYTARDDASKSFDVVTLDLNKTSNAMTRITQGQGDNLEPTFSPNGRVLAFASTRSGGAGIYLAAADGSGEQRLVYKGAAASPDWSR